MIKIVLTGGPCGGKTTCLSKLDSILTDRGYKLLVVPETATELMLNGVTYGDKLSLQEFQYIVAKKQKQKEDLYDIIAKYFDPEKTVVIYDRGLLDGAAYTTAEKFAEILKRNNLTLADIYGRYDGVFHLVSAAKDAEAYYEWAGSETCNNMARWESPEEAILSDDRTLNAWIGHPHLRIFNNQLDFDEKIGNVITEMFNMLGEPIPSEKERKFLIRMPDKKMLDNLKFCSKTNIIQTYLKTTEGKVERRVRQRGTSESGYTFYYTEKITTNRIGERIEKERKITFDDYIEYLAEVDTSLHQIVKTRYCFVHESQYFELDIYPFNNDYAILEIEVRDLNQEIDIPDYINIVKEVTDDVRFKNVSLAKTQSF